MVTKTDLHHLVDELPEDDVERAAQYLKGLRDPMLRALDDAPDDDEELTLEESAAIDESIDNYRRGKTVSSVEAKHELLDLQDYLNNQADSNTLSPDEEQLLLQADAAGKIGDVVSFEESRARRRPA